MHLSMAWSPYVCSRNERSTLFYARITICSIRSRQSLKLFDAWAYGHCLCKRCSARLLPTISFSRTHTDTHSLSNVLITNIVFYDLQWQRSFRSNRRCNIVRDRESLDPSSYFYGDLRTRIFFLFYLFRFVVFVSATIAIPANLRRLRQRWYRSPRTRPICIIPFAASLSTRLRFFMHFFFLFFFLSSYIFFFSFTFFDPRRFSRIIWNSESELIRFLSSSCIDSLTNYSYRWSFEIIEGYSISFDGR